MEVLVCIPFGDMMHAHDSEKSARIYRECLSNPAWWEARAKIMRDYTVPSLLAQSFKGFKVLATVRPETMLHAIPVINELSKLNTIVSVLPRDRTIVEEIKPEGDVLMVHLDSDDCYEQFVIEEMRSLSLIEGVSTILAEYGYYYDTTNGKMARVRMPGPPFFSWVYPLAATRSIDALGEYQFRMKMGFHHGLHQAVGLQRLDGYRYLQTIHGSNTSSTWANPNTNNKIVSMIEAPYQKRAALNTFHIEGVRDATQ